MFKFFGILGCHFYTCRMKPITAALALNHEVIWIIRHLTFTIHGNSIGIEGSGRGIVLESAKEVFITNSVELGVALEAVDRTLSFYGVGALYIIVVGEEDLLGAMELPPATDRLFRTVVPPDVNFHVASPAIRLDLLNSGNVRRLRRVR